MLFSDEASFHNNEDFNRHNCHYYSDINPFWLRRVDNQHQWRVNAWCGILDRQIVGPHFFNANLNGAMYLQFLQTDLQELMEDFANSQRHVVPTRWRPGTLCRYCPRLFKWKVFSTLDRQKWFHSLTTEFTRLNTVQLFFLWGYVKGIVFATEPTTPDDMQNRIRNAMALIPEEMLRRTTLSLQSIAHVPSH